MVFQGGTVDSFLFRDSLSLAEQWYELQEITTHESKPVMLTGTDACVLEQTPFSVVSPVAWDNTAWVILGMWG